MLPNFLLGVVPSERAPVPHAARSSLFLLFITLLEVPGRQRALGAFFQILRTVGQGRPLDSWMSPGGAVRRETMKNIELTDEIRDEEPVGYLVVRFNQTMQEYDVFRDENAAKHFARNQGEEDGEAEKSPPGEWPMYPLYASHPEMVEPTAWIGKRK